MKKSINIFSYKEQILSLFPEDDQDEVLGRMSSLHLILLSTKKSIGLDNLYSTTLLLLMSVSMKDDPMEDDISKRFMEISDNPDKDREFLITLYDYLKVNVNITDTIVNGLDYKPKPWDNITVMYI